MSLEQIREIGKALLPYLRNDLTDAELGTAAHDAVAALNRVARVDKWKWQPIETAPKDGSGILVYRPNATNTGREIGRDVWCKTYWWYSRVDEQPSHWVPLPDPPKETEE